MIEVNANPFVVFGGQIDIEEANLISVSIDPAEVAPSFISVGEAIISVNFDGEEGFEVTGSANNFYEVDSSQSESRNDLVDTTGTSIDGVLTIRWSGHWQLNPYQW